MKVNRRGHGMKRFFRRACVVVGLVALCLACKVAYDVRSLSAYRSFIEARYAPQIALVEQKCRDSPQGNLSMSEEDFLNEKKVVETIGKSLSGSEIYCASWSVDGHHGIAGLKRMETAYSRDVLTILGSHDASGNHSLYYGKTFDNRNLLVYEGWVEGGGKRQYVLVFLLDDIKNAANTEQPQSPPSADQPGG